MMGPLFELLMPPVITIGCLSMMWIFDAFNIDKVTHFFDNVIICSSNNSICTMINEGSSFVRVPGCRDMVGSCHGWSSIVGKIKILVIILIAYLMPSMSTSIGWGVASALLLCTCVG
jgi:hypothetical protein